MIPKIILNTKLVLLIGLGLLVVTASGCALYYNQYCKVFGYYLFGCIKPPSAGSQVLPPVPDEQVELGRLLFFDPRLSQDNSISCASCHLPSAGFADPRPFSRGVGDKEGKRNAPTVVNAAYQFHQFWDGRAFSLEQQALMPIEDSNEMGETLDNVVKKLNEIKAYKARFRAVFGEDVSANGIARAIAAFERTLTSTNSPFDQWVKGKPLSRAAQRGWKNVFAGKGTCAVCHIPPRYTDDKFHNIGVPRAAEKPDYGRYEFTKQEADKCAFKTPTLRNVAQTKPYMHTGGFADLRLVIEFYDNGGGEDLPGKPCGTKDPLVRKLGLTDEEKQDLLEFLESLSGDVPMTLEPPLPKSPPTEPATQKR